MGVNAREYPPEHPRMGLRFIHPGKTEITYPLCPALKLLALFATLTL
jgi:hypothetical protein